MIKLGPLTIGRNNRPVFVAEISANHAGNIETALATLKMAKAAGADLVKIQTYTPDTLTIDCDKDDFIVKQGLWQGSKLYDLYSRAYTPYEWHSEIFAFANKLELPLISTPFDESAVELLESLSVPAYKVASFELTDLPLIECIARTKKPVILSTGMANLSEIKEAVAVLEEYGSGEVVILHCVSGYPTPVDQANVATLALLQQEFPKHLTGLSDHSASSDAASTAVALGACLVEKHVTLSKQIDSPDASFSLVQNEIEQHVRAMTNAWRALGRASFELKSAEENSQVFRRSLYVVKDIQKGEIFDKDNVRRIRPGFGMAPKHYLSVLGKTASEDIERGTALHTSLIQGWTE